VAAGQLGRVAEAHHEGAIRSGPHLCPGRLASPEPPRAGPQAPGLPLPALAQRPRPPPRRLGCPAPRAGPRPRRAPATLGTTQTRSRAA